MTSFIDNLLQKKPKNHSSDFFDETDNSWLEEQNSDYENTQITDFNDSILNKTQSEKFVSLGGSIEFNDQKLLIISFPENSALWNNEKLLEFAKNSIPNRNFYDFIFNKTLFHKIEHRLFVIKKSDQVVLANTPENYIQKRKFMEKGGIEEINKNGVYILSQSVEAIQKRGSLEFLVNEFLEQKEKQNKKITLHKVESENVFLYICVLG